MPRQFSVRSGHPYRTQVKYDDDDEPGRDDMTINLRGAPEDSDSEPDDRKHGGRTRTDDAGFDIEATPTGREPTPPSGGLVLGGGQTIKLMLVPDKAAAPAPPPPKKEKPHPQTKMKKFWLNFDPEYVGKVTRVLPDPMTGRDTSKAKLVGETAHRAIRSYEAAKESCIRDVNRIIKECRNANQKYTDSHWDIERDLKITRLRDCLDGLVVDDSDKEYPADAKRVTVSWLHPLHVSIPPVFSTPTQTVMCNLLRWEHSRISLKTRNSMWMVLRTTTSYKARLETAGS
jgi:hypothetical protein